jgi:glycosyltransferase involved in cell wall biosynthesis
MKICHLTSVHRLNDTRIFYKECKSLAVNGHEVYLVGFGKSIIQDNVNVIGLEPKPKNRIERITRGVRRVVKEGLKLNCDIYHLHDPELIPYIPLLKSKGKKIIFDSHENTSEQIKEKKHIPFRRLLSVFYSMMEKLLLSHVDALIFVTPSMANKMKKINKNAYLITNYPITTTLFSSDYLDLPSEKFICFIGGIYEKWNHKNIVRGLQNIENVKYLLYGPTDNESLIRQLKMIDQKNVLDFRGFITPSDVQSIYSKATVGVSWLRENKNTGGKEGTLGVNKLFEQMMAGIPVIVSDFRLWREIIEENNCGIVVDQDDVNGFTQAIEYLINNPSKAKIMGENGRKAVMTKYNWETQVEILLGIYDRLGT